MFYLRSRHGDTGCNVTFHNKDGYGYGTDLDKLHHFTKEKAQEWLDEDIKSLPLLVSEVDKLAIRAVDMQYLRCEKNLFIGSDSFVIQKHGVYNGNDIYFKSEDGYTYDYFKAKRYLYSEGVKIAASNHDYIAWSTSYLDTISRRTFQSQNINVRKMVTGAGIKYKKPRKRKPTTGKTRGNCPTCGKITWDHNPYENAYCDIFCKP